MKKYRGEYLRSRKLWRVWCDECTMFSWFTKPDGTTHLPHDIAAGHHARYHKG